MLLMCFYVNLELKMSREAIWVFSCQYQCAIYGIRFVIPNCINSFLSKRSSKLALNAKHTTYCGNIHKFGKRLFTEELMS